MSSYKDLLRKKINAELIYHSGVSKWAPREKGTKSYWAYKLRKHMGMEPRQYRKMLVSLTDVVEQKMAAGNWSKINFEHVPSLASIRYQKAFERHVPGLYNKYITKLETGDAKINAGAVYPHDVVMSINTGNERVAEQQWKALPDFVGSDKSYIPLIDTSGSMCQGISGSLTAIDVSVSLGIYLAQRNKSVFKDKFITFSESPSWVDLSGLSLKQAVNKTYTANWGMNTNIEKAFQMILNAAVKGNVPKEDMPEYMLIVSDMQFDVAVRSSKNKPQGMIKEQYKNAGYDVPKIVYWNLVDYGTNIPVTSTKKDVALVSGFSPSIMKTVLSDPELFTPFNIMMKAVNVPRYDWKK